MPLVVMGFLTPRDLSSGDVPKEIYNSRIYLLAFCASMGSAMFGYDSAFIGGSIGLASFKSRFNFSNASPSAKSALSANIVSTFQAGCFFGCILCWLITRNLGRRSILMICGALFNVGVILEIASPGILGLIYAGRVVTGLAVGASSMIIPTYISECAPPALRGRLVGIFEIFIQVSQIVGFWVNYGVQLHISNSSDTQWRLPFGLQLVPGTLLLFTMPFQPESPRWLMQKNRPEVARKSLARIRKLPEDHPYVNWEIGLINSQIVGESERNPSTIINHLKGPFAAKIWPRLLIGMALMLLQNLSGINALNYYSPTIFQSIGFSGDSVKLLATGVFGIVKTVTTMVYMIFIIDRFGRRVPMLVGSVGAAFAMYYLGTYTAKSGSFSGEAPKDGGAYAAIVMIYVFAVFYAFSWNGIPWIFCAEVFPNEYRSVCQMFTTCTQWLAQFMIAYSTPYMMTNIKYGTFFFFAAWVTVGFAFVYFFMPETKGLAIEDVDILFSTKGTAKAKRAAVLDILVERQAANLPGILDDTKPAAKHIEI